MDFQETMIKSRDNDMMNANCEKKQKSEILQKSRPTLGLVDTHAHLTDVAFQGEVEQIVCHAKECGVGGIITSGYDLQSSKDAIALAEKFEGVFASVGYYPENCLEFDEKALKIIAKHEKVVAIGEIGLQYTDNMPQKDRQIEVFEKQIRLACVMGLPIVIHCRDAYGDCLEVLKRNSEYLKYGGTLHCYSGSLEMAQEFVKLGLHISIGGVSTFKNAEKTKKVAKEIPLNKILLETDCPYLTPHPYRGKRNDPSFIPTIAENLALLKGVSVEEVACVTSQNARRLFKI